MEKELQNLVDKKLKSNLPYNEDAERMIVCAILLDSTMLWTAANIVKHNYFHVGMIGHIFKAMVLLAQEGKAIDMISVDAKMKDLNIQIPGGGIVYMSKILYGLPFFTDKELINWCNIVLKEYKRRALISKVREVEANAFDNKVEIDNLINTSASQIFNLVPNSIDTGLLEAKSLTAKSLQRVELAREAGNIIVGLKTGYKDFDSKTLGLAPGDQMIIAARPSMGKTTLLLNIAAHCALRERKKVLLFSLEMSKEQLIDKIICSEARVALQRYKNGFLQQHEWERVHQAVETIDNSQLLIDDNPDATPGYMHSQCMRSVAEDGIPIGLVGVDYLQLMSQDKKNDNKYQEVSGLSRDLKKLARVLKCPMMTLSQLSRAPEARKPPRPIMSDLRESGSIEQDADLVTFIYREEYYSPTIENAGQAEFLLSKNRNGPTGAVNLTWLAEIGRFDNFSPEF